MKTKILFVIESLVCGGAEKSLITLLNLIDYSKFDVSLQLFKLDGEFMKYLPTEVHLLPLLDSTEQEKENLLKNIIKGHFKAFFAHLCFSIHIRQKSCRNNNDIFRNYWHDLGKLITPSIEEYDVAIAYGQRLPTFYVAHKVKANRKLAWINIIPQWNKQNADFLAPAYAYFDKIICVSEASRKASCEQLHLPIEKTHLVTDIVDPNIIYRLSDEEPGYELDTTRPIILTVARLDYVCKGYDITLETAKILRDRGVNFVWYALGKGNKYEDMKKYILENHLENHFIMLGATSNPYPYFKRCKLYVQTSRYEGYGITLAEARILNRPIVTTEFGCVWKQMIQGENGIVTPINAEKVADAIQELLSNKDLYYHIQQYQMSEKKGNVEEMANVYKAINGEI